MQRLSGLDAGFLAMETPTVHMHTLKLAILDPPPAGGGHPADLPIEWLRDRITERLHLLPPLRRRVIDVPLRLHHPVWIDDPDFAIEHHVRRVPVPSPGGRAEVQAVVGALASRPLDRTRPLWELTLLDGLADDRIGVLVKLHHAVADGTAVAHLLANVMSEVEAATELGTGAGIELGIEAGIEVGIEEGIGEAVDASAAVAGTATPTGSAPPAPAEAPAWTGEPIPSAATLVRDALQDHLRQLAHLPPLVGRTLRNGVVVLRHRRHPGTPKALSPPRPVIDAPRTPFNRALTADRVFVTTTLPLADVQRVRSRLPVTVNDVVLTIAAGALRTYLLEQGCLPDRALVAAVPIATDAAPRLAGNKVANLFTTLATDEPDPRRRLLRIHEVTAEAKELQRLLGVELLQDWVEYTPPAPYAWIVRQHSRLDLADHHPPPVNVVVSNVPGPSRPLVAAGARLAALYSVGPVLEGVGLNITVWSYLDRLHVGILGCPQTLPQADRLPGAMQDALAALVEAVSGSASDPPVAGDRQPVQ